MASKRQVESKLRELIRRLDGAGTDVRSSLSGALPDDRVVQVTIPDLDATYWAKLSRGAVGELNKGAPVSRDIGIRVASDDLVALVDGEKSLMSSYLGGKVKIEASLSDLIRLRRLG